MAFNSISLTKTAATLAEAMEIRKPTYADEPIDQVMRMVKRLSKSGKAQKVLVYNPDAIGGWLYQKYNSEFTPVMERTRLVVPMLAAFPPVTPVCFGTMFSGAEPKTHGITVYEKKLITIETLFDVLPEAGKKTALITRTDSSMSKIFLNRPIDYDPKDSDAEALADGLEALKSKKYDFIEVYQMDYDDSIHETEPESKRSLEAMKRHIRDFARIVDCMSKVWNDQDVLFLFAPDHGIHKTIFGNGDHYCDMPEDMNMFHFYGFKPAGGTY